MVPKFKNTPEVDSFLEWLAAEDAREEKQRAAIEQQRERDRPRRLSEMHLTGKQLLLGFGVCLASLVGIYFWLVWVFNWAVRP